MSKSQFSNQMQKIQNKFNKLKNLQFVNKYLLCEKIQLFIDNKIS